MNEIDMKSNNTERLREYVLRLGFSASLVCWSNDPHFFCPLLLGSQSQKRTSNENFDE